MAVILIATDDAAAVSHFGQTLASLGHTPLPLASTENIVEDVTLNGVAAILIAENIGPYSSWDCCEMLRRDPTVPADLPVFMLTPGRGNVRRLEKCGFTGTMEPQITAGELAEELSRHLGENAAPEDIDPLADLRLG